MNNQPLSPDFVGITLDGVLIPHACWETLMVSVTAVIEQNEKLLTTIARLLDEDARRTVGNHPRPEDPYSLDALRRFL